MPWLLEEGGRRERTLKFKVMALWGSSTKPTSFHGMPRPTPRQEVVHPQGMGRGKGVGTGEQMHSSARELGHALGCSPIPMHPGACGAARQGAALKPKF